MKLEQQVLCIDQVRELQDLGFNVNKYASMCWVKYTSDEEPYKETYHLTTLDESCYETSCLSPIPTLTIGDIIDILPEKIAPIYYLEISKNLVDYCSNDKSINGEVEERLIDALFETLKWCIKEKHIAL